MSELKIKKVGDGLWEIVGRGTIELTPQGIFYCGMNKRGKWEEGELKQITEYIEALRKAKESPKP